MRFKLNILPFPFVIVLQLLEKLGCRLARNGLGQLAFEVGDPLGFRKQVESHLRKNHSATRELACETLDGIRASREFCEAALRPLVPTKPGHVETGDTLSRVLLSVPVLQEPFGVPLLQLIPGILESGDETAALSVLGQFKWLESVDPGAGQEIIRALCALLADPSCTVELRAAVASLLPELASVSETEVLEGQPWGFSLLYVALTVTTTHPAPAVVAGGYSSGSFPPYPHVVNHRGASIAGAYEQSGRACARKSIVFDAPDAS